MISGLRCRLNISVVIPSLDSEEELPRCLDSLRSQLSGSDEIIIVDAGSKDRTLEIASKNGCKLVYYPDSNIGQARDFGVEVAKNEVIIQTDTDVEFIPNFLDQVRRYFEQNSELVGVSFGWRDGTQKPLGQLGCALFEGVFKYADCIQSYRRSAYYRTSGHPSVSFGEQIGFWLQLKQLGITIYDPELYVYHYSVNASRYMSYIVGGSLLTGGIAYETGIGGSIGYGIIGAGAGFVLGQLGVDMGINADAPANHYHHFHLGLTILAVGLTLLGADVNEDLSVGLLGLGAGIAAHDALTDENLF
jgi:glycosyltransferase involved in cell wall biosynthesis